MSLKDKPPRTSSPPKASLIPVGTIVDVIGGVHVGQQATILGHTPKMYNIQLSEGRITVIKQGNVKAPSNSSESPRSFKSETMYRRLIELEMVKIQESLQNITKLLDQMSLTQMKE